MEAAVMKPDMTWKAKGTTCGFYSANENYDSVLRMLIISSAKGIIRLFFVVREIYFV